MYVPITARCTACRKYTWHAIATKVEPTSRRNLLSIVERMKTNHLHYPPTNTEPFEAYTAKTELQHNYSHS